MRRHIKCELTYPSISISVSVTVFVRISILNRSELEGSVDMREVSMRCFGWANDPSLGLVLRTSLYRGNELTSRCLMTLILVLIRPKAL